MTSRPLASVVVLLAALGCGVPKPEPSPTVEKSAHELVGYDVRRLRPRNDQPLADAFEHTFSEAREQGKTVAVLFSADWCEPCRALDTELGAEHPEEMIGHVRIVELKEEDWESVTRMDEVNGLRARWHRTLDSYPVLVVLDRDGNKVEEMKEAIDRLEAAGLEATLPVWLGTLRNRSG